MLMFARTSAAVDRLFALGASIEARDRRGATPMQALSRLGRRGTARSSVACTRRTWKQGRR
jgi:hypothetical protein